MATSKSGRIPGGSGSGRSSIGVVGGRSSSSVGGGNSSREGSAKTIVADQITQAVQSTSNLLHLMLQSSPSQGQLMKLPKSLLAKTSTIKNTEMLLQQMPRVISELDAHMDNGLQSVSHLKTVIQLLENIESCQLKPLQQLQTPKEDTEPEGQKRQVSG